MQIDFIYSLCLKKNHDPLLDQPESSDSPLSISNFLMTPFYPFAAPYPPLEINNDRSLSAHSISTSRSHNNFKTRPTQLMCYEFESDHETKK